MTILTHQRDRPVIESRQDHRAAAMMHDLARVGLVGFAHGIDRDINHTAGEDFLRIEELRSLISHLFCPTAFRSSEQVLSSRLQYASRYCCPILHLLRTS